MQTPEPIKIDHDIPIPNPEYQRRQRKYPIADMAVGDSFFAHAQRSESVSSSLTKYRKMGRRFTARTVTENGVKGVRLWRIA